MFLMKNPDDIKVTIKPFTTEYTEKCADLLQHLWKENAADRIDRFVWSYLNNPNVDFVTAVIAVNEQDEVIGFRGYHTLQIYLGKEKRRIAYIADTVVSPNIRRMGLFKKMTEYSFQFLIDNDIKLISNLGPSWPPYHGYKKLGFSDLHIFTSRYRFHLTRLIKAKTLGYNKPILESDYTKQKSGITYYVSNKLPNDNVLSQIDNASDESLIMPYRGIDNLKWKSAHPKANYIYVYALNESGKLLTFLWFKYIENGVYNLALYQSVDKSTLGKAYKLFAKHCKPTVVAAWDWAITSQSKKILDRLNFVKIPFFYRLRKNPPAIVRSLVSDDKGLNWVFNGIDISKAENWIVDKIEADSF